MTLGEKFKLLRKKRNVSQTELAEVLQVSADYLLSEDEEEITTSLTSDKELLQQFQDISKLKDADKQFIKRIIKMAINDSKIKEMAS